MYIDMYRVALLCLIRPRLLYMCMYTHIYIYIYIYTCIMCCIIYVFYAMFAVSRITIVHTCHILPPSEIDLGLCLAVFAGSGGK